MKVSDNSSIRPLIALICLYAVSFIAMAAMVIINT